MCRRQPTNVSGTSTFLSLSFSLPPPLSKNEQTSQNPSRNGYSARTTHRIEIQRALKEMTRNSQREKHRAAAGSSLSWQMGREEATARCAASTGGCKLWKATPPRLSKPQSRPPGTSLPGTCNDPSLRHTSRWAAGRPGTGTGCGGVGESRRWAADGVDDRPRGGCGAAARRWGIMHP